MLPYLRPITPATKYFLSRTERPIISFFAHFMAFIGGTAVRKLYCVLIGVPLGTVRAVRLPFRVSRLRRGKFALYDDTSDRGFAAANPPA